MTGYKQKQKENKLAWKLSRAGYKPQFMKDENGIFAVLHYGMVYKITHAGWLRVGVM